MLFFIHLFYWLLNAADFAFLHSLERVVIFCFERSEICFGICDVWERRSCGMCRWCDALWGSIGRLCSVAYLTICDVVVGHVLCQGSIDGTLWILILKVLQNRSLIYALIIVIYLLLVFSILKITWCTRAPIQEKLRRHVVGTKVTFPLLIHIKIVLFHLLL